MLPISDPWIKQCAAAATPQDRTVGETDEADFSQSVMIGPNKIREGDTIDCEIILRNTGSKRPDYVELGIGIGSPSAVFASAPELSYNLEKRELHWRGTVEPGEERHFTFRFVTIPKSAGTWTSAYASVVWGSWVSTHWDVRSKSIGVDPIEVRSKKGNARILFMVGRIELGWLEVAILGYLLFVPLCLITIPWLIRWRERQRFERSPDVSRNDDVGNRIMVYGMSIAFVASLVFMPFIASIVVKDIRKFTSYEKTTCTILDKTIRESKGKTKSYYDPLVSVRYNIKGKEILSAGFLPRGLGRESSAEKRLARYELGKSYPCWFDPEAPWEFVLTRSPSWGWYPFFLPPLILFWISSRYLLRKLRGPEVPSEMPNAPIQ